ncbi:alpha/beta hydrolase [Streptomyces sp. ZAF1911]|uniref:alpha/beta fold hydrolase n=1 Tax=Streptomyces sp. ZAF1911 TaxID=2944129 RepID=UPI00237AE6D3|nr:alpha/beta hydrolase [Streptomyces sp. ZAF1911]MDD9380144.1 alpha/beta hydrolase [Streptomyces sp. ZAF1911]
MSVSEAADRAGIFVRHAFGEHTVDLGEIRMNYVVEGAPEAPALLLVPGGADSWWTYEEAIGLLSSQFQVFAVDTRGQGRSTWTPGRYTLDNFGNDLVRFMDLVIKRPAIVAGNSVGGVMTAWLAAYAKPGQVRAAILEDPPLFACEIAPAYGPGVRTNLGPVFVLRSKWLGNQWSIGDWDGLVQAAPKELPGMLAGSTYDPEPPQHLKEFDPEVTASWASGLAFASSDHETFLEQVRVPVLFTHHARMTDPETGHMLGACTDLQAQNACRIMQAAGQPVTYTSLPDAAHQMHAADPHRYVKIVADWITTLE